MLFDLERHTAIDAPAWDVDTARAAVDRIANDTAQAFRPYATPAGTVPALWPVHPIDRSPERPDDWLKPLFNGAGGVLWAMRRLRAQGANAPALEDAQWLQQLPDLQRADDVQLERAPSPSFAIGDTGLALLAWRDEPSPATTARLQSAITACAQQAEQGFALGAAGALLAALHAFDATQDSAWQQSFTTIADELWARFEYAADCGGYHWLQTLYGHRDRQLGALHGFAGIVHILAAGFRRFDDPRFELLASRSCESLRSAAQRAARHANWPLAIGESSRPTARALWLQFCIGAPGVVACTSWIPPSLDADFDALLLAAGELIWQAGPTTKLPSLCHGAPGSGYAFLRLYERTGDARWLGRARQFAMHGIGAAERAREQYGQRKYSLFTGDLGLALYLQDCVIGEARMPLFDVF